MFRSASDLYNQVVEAAQNQELWGRSRTKPGENRIKNDIRCSAPFRICIKRVVEAKQNQELWERSYTNQERIHANCSKVRIKCGVPLRFGFVLSELWKPNKTRSCGERNHTNQENPCKLLLHKRENEIRCSAPLRICIKRVVEAKQNQELWERRHTKPCKLLLHKRKNEIRCSAPLRICLANYKLSKTS